MKTMTVLCDDALRTSVSIAITRWNKIMAGRVQLQLHRVGTKLSVNPDITIFMGQVLQNPQGTVTARCNTESRKQPDGSMKQRHTILFNNLLKWDLNGWDRFWGTHGNNGVACAMHELGHALGFGHSPINNRVMNLSLGTTVFSVEETEELIADWDGRNTTHFPSSLHHS